MQARAILEDGLHILQLSGEIDMQSSPELRAYLAGHADARRPALLIDFSGVEYIDSSGLATIVEYVQSSSQFGGRLAIGGVNERVRTVFNLVRLDEIFPVHESLADARAAILPPPGA
jgi:anti-sigma B factor antagonist